MANIGKPEDVDKDCSSMTREASDCSAPNFVYEPGTHACQRKSSSGICKKVAAAVNGKPVIIRTPGYREANGDSEYMGLEKDENPFLGYRAIRVSAWTAGGCGSRRC